MNIPELLTHLGSEQLRDLSRIVGSGKRSPSARALLQELIRAYRDPEVLTENLDLLDSESRRFLTLLIRFVGRSGVGFHIPPSLSESWGGETQIKPITEELISFGLLFPQPTSEDAQPSGRHHNFIIPSDMGDALLDLLTTKPEWNLTFPAQTPPPADILAKPTRALTYAFMRLLVLAKRGKAKMTNAGRAAKRSVDLWSESLPPDSLPGELPYPNENSFHEHSVTGVFEFLLDFALESDLVRQHGGEIVTTRRIESWFESSSGYLLYQLFMHYVLQRIYPSRPHQVAAARLLTAKEWSNPCSLSEIVGEQIVWSRRIVKDDSNEAKQKETSKGDTKEIAKSAQRIINEIVAFGAMCGLIEIGISQSEQKRVWIRRSPQCDDIELSVREALSPARAQSLQEMEEAAKEAEDTQISPAILQPTYEMMVPPDMPLSSLWQIESFADFKTADVMSTYVITRGSFTRALREGLEFEELKTRISGFAPGPLPQNVAFSFEDWGQRYGQIQMQRGYFLRCQAKELAEEIQHIPEISELITEQVSDTILLVKEGSEEELFERLERFDYSPKAFKSSKKAC